MKRLVNAAAAVAWGVLAVVLGVNIADEVRGRRLRREAEQRVATKLVIVP